MTPECQNCGAHITHQYVRVFEPEDVDDPRACPWCPDLVRREGEPKEARSTRSAARTL